MSDKKTDDEEEVRLRDQIAIAAMQALLQNHNNYKSYIEREKETYGEGTSNEETKDEYFERIDGRIERLALSAYRIADAMRKARLKVFK